MTSVLAWYVAKVKPRNEHHVQTYLERFGVEVYAPEMLVLRSGRKRNEPLFPSYLFVKVDPSSGMWPLVHWARGMSYFLGDQRDPTPCSDVLLDTIRARVGQWNGGGWEEAFRSGDRVVIRSGPFKELDAIFQRYVPGRERCHVLVSLMDRSIPVILGVAAIESMTLRRRFAEVG
ncbi:MAG: hypothetical protein EXR55_06925 [Dehalococcoidia bacterium]|nr:hypothetical protein [Dehalococcoidia bacterium]